MPLMYSIIIYSKLPLADIFYRRDFRLLIRGDNGKPIVHPVLWGSKNVTSAKEVSVMDGSSIKLL